MASMILIVAAGTIVLAGIVIALVSILSGNRTGGQGVGPNRNVVVFDGIDTKSLSVGKGKGAIFRPGMDDFGTIIKGGYAKRMWHVHFHFQDTGRTENVTFSNCMAIGRKRSEMGAYRGVEIGDDRLVSGVHCYLIGMKGTLQIKDAGSLNHTYLNEHMVKDITEVPNGSIIRVGHTKMRITYEYR